MNPILSIEIPNVCTINIKATMKGTYQDKQTRWWNYKYNIRIWSENHSYNFTWHDSAYAYQRGIRVLNRNRLLLVLDSILSDVSLYLNDEIKGIYDEIEEAALLRDVENSCRRHTENFSEVVGGDANIWTAIEFLTDFVNSNY